MLQKLMQMGADASIWEFCWNYLVYQESIGEVSYAAVPYLVEFVRKSERIDWNAVALVSAIELARSTGPKVPDDVKDDYFKAIESFPLVLLQHPQKDWDADTTQSAASCIALARGQFQLGRLYGEMGLEDGLEWLRLQGE
jgi:hypothetical protein